MIDLCHRLHTSPSRVGRKDRSETPCALENSIFWIRVGPHDDASMSLEGITSNAKSSQRLQNTCIARE